MATAKIQMKDVRYCYGDVCALDQMNATIPPHTLTALIGPNGGGKSTMIKLISGLLRPEEGSVVVGDDKGVGYVSQSPDFDPNFPFTVRELVLMGTLTGKIRPFARFSNAQKEQADHAMERVHISDVAKRGVSQLSGGQRKRAMIARALASSSDVIVLDEPDAGLDIDASEELYDILNELKSDKTVLVASHHIDAVLGIADGALYVHKSAQAYAPEELQDKLKEGLVL